MTAFACLWTVKWWIAGAYGLIGLSAIIERNEGK